jgi:hypothetical protein
MRMDFKKQMAFCLLIILLPVAAYSEDLRLPNPPRIPKFMAKTVKIDPARMQKMAQDYQSAKDREGTLEDFMFAAMPEQVFNSILRGSKSAKDFSSDLGLLYWSGYQGGIWLNSIMQSPGEKKSGIGPTGMIKALKLPALLYVNNMLRKRMRLVSQGEKSEKMKALDKSLDALISSYGYNRGYLLEILDHPPQGCAAPEDFFTCSSLLDCAYAGKELKLIPPGASGTKWGRFNSRLSEKLPQALDQGKNVWKNIMAEKEFSPKSYQDLLNISAEFLIINQEIMLASVTAIADGDEREMERALLADAAFRTWLIGYMIGLGASPE